MTAPGLQDPAKKALATLDREWDGLIAHRDYPMISLDNNAAERMIRGPVVTRKNAGGSRNEAFARLAATIWTATATAQLAGLNLLTWLTAYLDACGRGGGRPLSGRAWNASCPGTPAPKTSAPGRSHPRSPANPPHPAITTAPPARTGHAVYRHARSQDFRILTSWLSPEEIRAAVETHQDLGPAYRDVVIASFLDKAARLRRASSRSRSSFPTRPPAGGAAG